MGVAVVSILEFSGDPEELMSNMRGVEDVASRKAAGYGGVSSTVCRTDDGIMLINMWSDTEGRHRMAEDPEIQQAIQDAGLPQPAAKGYQVLEHRTPS